jgi:hypothetical protein
MTRVRWWADRSGMAHGYRSGRTLCHAQSCAERDAWPTIRRCSRCAAIASEASPGGTPPKTPTPTYPRPVLRERYSDDL